MQIGAKERWGALEGAGPWLLALTEQSAGTTAYVCLWPELAPSEPESSLPVPSFRQLCSQPVTAWWTLLKSVEEPRILGSLWGVGDGARIPGSPKAQLGLTDRRQVRPGSPDCNFDFFFPKCVILSQSVSFVFVFPARVSYVALATLELAL